MAAGERDLETGAPEEGRERRLRFPCTDEGRASARFYTISDGMQIVVQELNTLDVEGIPQKMDLCDDLLQVVFCRTGDMMLRMEPDPMETRQCAGTYSILRGDESRFRLRMLETRQVDVTLRFELPRITPSVYGKMLDVGVDLQRILDDIGFTSGLAVCEPAPELHHAFMELYDLMTAPERNLGRLRLKALETVLLLGMELSERAARRKADGHQVRLRAGDGRRQMAYRAQQVMTVRLADPIAIGELAAACHASPTALKEAFRAVFGRSIGSWYRGYRIRCACELLQETDLSIAEVARAVGYASPSRFTDAFKAVRGCLPRAWRSRHREGA